MNLSSTELAALNEICRRANPNDSWTVLAQLPVQSMDERNSIVKSLESNGLITKVVLLGRDKVQCMVTTLAFSVLNSQEQ